MNTVDAFIAAAESYIGTPFKHQGRLPGLHLDCAGTMVCAARAAGLPVADRIDYGRRAQGAELEKELDAQSFLDRVPVGELLAGDLLVMQFTGAPQHLGVFDGQFIIHAYQPAGKVCRHTLTDEWRKRIIRVYRIKEDHGR